MTLDEAIKRAEEVAEEQEKAAKEWHENQVRKCELIRFAEMDYTHENECQKCAEEHRQLVEWLKDYKRLKEQEPCEDTVSRQAVLELVADYDLSMGQVVKGIHALPPVTPQPKIGYCKDCKWWKDSDGVYRRGVRAESICPINREEVWKGEGYCFLYEPKIQEEGTIKE